MTFSQLLVGASSNNPSGLDVATFVVSTVTATAAVVIALQVATFNTRRALAADRAAVREELRDWFKGLSTTATAADKRGHEALRSRIEEVSDAESYGEIASLMDWAREMHLESFRREGQGTITAEEAHQRRIIIKRRFRQCIARWAVRRRSGRNMIFLYCSEGWNAIQEEQAQAVKSANYLLPLPAFPSFRVAFAKVRSTLRRLGRSLAKPR